MRKASVPKRVSNPHGRGAQAVHLCGDLPDRGFGRQYDTGTECRQMRRTGTLGRHRGREFRNDAADVFFTVVGVRGDIEIDFRRVKFAAAPGTEQTFVTIDMSDGEPVLTAGGAGFLDDMPLHADTLAGHRRQRHPGRSREIECTKHEGYVSFPPHSSMMPHSASFPIHSRASRRATSGSTS